MEVSSTVGVRGDRRRHAIVALVVAGLAVLALLSVFAIELSNTQAKSKRDVISRVHERSVLAVALIDSLLQSAEQQARLLPRRYGTRAVSARTMNAARQQNLYAALVDSSGRVVASSAGFTAQARADLSRSAALALVRSGLPYGLGNRLPYGRTGVINFAVAFPTHYGTRYLLTGLDPAAMSPFLGGELRRIPGVKGATSYVIDGNDTVLASTNPSRPPGYRYTNPAAIRALSTSSGDRKGHYYDQARLSNSTWRLVLAAPDGAFFASVSGWRKWLPWLIFVAFALVGATALLLGGRMVRSAESGLRDANAQLAAVNHQLEVANAALAHDALHDSLTGLPNRALFMDRVEQVLRRSSRDSAIGCAVLFIDLDGFKLVNDSLSHAVGDQLLVAVAARFREVLRPGDTVARIGGDEFTVLLESVVAEHDATLVADRVQRSLRHSFEVGPHKLFVGASIGIALRSPGIDASDLVRNADIAMYDIKRRARSSYAVFDETMRRRVVDRLARENELRRAIEDSLIRVHFQPIIDLHTRRITGFEALARWPSGWSNVAASEFIPLAEDSGLIGPLGRQVLRTAVDALAGWRRAGLVADDVRVSVNISRRQLDDPALPDEILDALDGAGLPGDNLRLEITESTLMQEPQSMQRMVSEVCTRGVGLHLDDFGTQYSSLAALLQFPVVALKIDRSFITSVLGHDSGSDTIVRAMIGLAHELDLTAIAEGIEDADELDRLLALGCDLGQGSLFSEPLDRAHVQELLASWSARERVQTA